MKTRNETKTEKLTAGKRLLRLILLLAALSLELLPGSALPCSADGTRSYADPAVFVSGNFGPFAAFCATVLLLVLSLIELAAKKDLRRFMTLLAYFAFLCSVLPLFFGGDRMTLCGWGILLLLAGTVLVIKGVGNGNGNKNGKYGKNGLLK